MYDVKVKQIIRNGVKTQYFLFSNGDLYNANTHLISSGSLSNGYIRFQLNIDGEIVSYAKHRLLAEYFLENDDPEHKTVVHHKDGCPRNNKLENLEWTTQKENCNKRVNPNEHKITEILTEEELAKEEWRKIPDANYEVSNMGRIKNLGSGYITFGSRNKNSGYIRWTYINNEGKRKEAQAHRMVYMLFHPNEEIDVINHIDSNRGNNRLSNLENITQQENVIKSYYLTKTKITCFTGQYDLNNNLIAVYPSTSEAARQTGIRNTSNLFRAMKTGGTSHGFYWRELTKEEYESFIEQSQVSQ